MQSSIKTFCDHHDCYPLVNDIPTIVQDFLRVSYPDGSAYLINRCAEALFVKLNPDDSVKGWKLLSVYPYDSKTNAYSYASNCSLGAGPQTAMRQEKIFTRTKYEVKVHRPYASEHPSLFVDHYYELTDTLVNKILPQLISDGYLYLVKIEHRYRLTDGFYVNSQDYVEHLQKALRPVLISNSMAFKPKEQFDLSPKKRSKEDMDVIEYSVSLETGLSVLRKTRRLLIARTEKYLGLTSLLQIKYGKDEYGKRFLKFSAADDDLPALFPPAWKSLRIPSDVDLLDDIDEDEGENGIIQMALDQGFRIILPWEGLYQDIIDFFKEELFSKRFSK